jgi:hypothetical protein
MCSQKKTFVCQFSSCFIGFRHEKELVAIVDGSRVPYDVPEADDVPMSCPSCKTAQRGKFEWHRHLLLSHKLDFDFKRARAGPVVEEEDDAGSAPPPAAPVATQPTTTATTTKASAAKEGRPTRNARKRTWSELEDNSPAAVSDASSGCKTLLLILNAFFYSPSIPKM